MLMAQKSFFKVTNVRIIIKGNQGLGPTESAKEVKSPVAEDNNKKKSLLKL